MWCCGRILEIVGETVEVHTVESSTELLRLNLAIRSPVSSSIPSIATGLLYAPLIEDMGLLLTSL